MDGLCCLSFCYSGPLSTPKKDIRNRTPSNHISTHSKNDPSKNDGANDMNTSHILSQFGLYLGVNKKPSLVLPMTNGQAMSLTSDESYLILPREDGEIMLLKSNNNVLISNGSFKKVKRVTCIGFINENGLDPLDGGSMYDDLVVTKERNGYCPYCWHYTDAFFSSKCDDPPIILDTLGLSTSKIKKLKTSFKKVIDIKKAYIKDVLAFIETYPDKEGMENLSKTLKKISQQTPSSIPIWRQIYHQINAPVPNKNAPMPNKADDYIEKIEVNITHQLFEQIASTLKTSTKKIFESIEPVDIWIPDKLPINILAYIHKTDLKNWTIWYGGSEWLVTNHRLGTDNRKASNNSSLNQSTDTGHEIHHLFLKNKHDQTMHTMTIEDKKIDESRVVYGAPLNNTVNDSKKMQLMVALNLSNKRLSHPITNSNRLGLNKIYSVYPRCYDVVDINSYLQNSNTYGRDDILQFYMMLYLDMALALIEYNESGFALVDVKKEQYIYDRKGHVLLTDLDSGCKIGCQAKNVTYTNETVAPEIASKTCRPHKNTDVYSLSKEFRFEIEKGALSNILFKTEKTLYKTVINSHFLLKDPDSRQPLSDFVSFIQYKLHSYNHFKDIENHVKVMRVRSIEEWLKIADKNY